MDSSIEIEKITAPDSFQRLGPEWSLLWDRSALATPFQAPEWLFTWWKYLGGRSLWTLAVRREGRLVGLAPLFVHQWPDGQARRVSWIGAGISDLLDLLIDSEFSLPGAAALFRYFRDNTADWDIIDLQDLRPESPLLRNKADFGLRTRVVPAGVCPAFSLPDSVESFRGRLSKNHKRNLTRARRKLETSGELWVKIAAADDLSPTMRDLFRLHEACWRKKNPPAMLAQPSLQNFHLEAASAFLKTGRLRLYSLQFEGETIACLYALVKGDRVFGCLSGFDPRLEKFSPGTLLLNYILEDSIHRGFREFDFLRGAEAYKYVWGARDRPNYRLVIWHSDAEIRFGDMGEVSFAGEPS
jgi:CelD/BcsL family acetyltransferase involved in cellulose biosynthesis